MKWQKIDELETAKRRYLADTDNVYYLREYTAKEGFRYSNTNSLISNLQKGVNCPPNQSYYRDQAIDEFARELRHIIQNVGRNSLIVGMPPRQSLDDEEYDDRLDLVVERSVRDLPKLRHVRIIENFSTRRELKDQEKRTPNYLKEFMQVNDVDLEGSRDLLIIDDVLTSGCSVRAVSELMEEVYPHLNLWFFAWSKVVWTNEIR